MIRTFIAAVLPATVRKQIYNSFMANPNFKFLPVRWTPMGNLHLTLQFLGDIEEKRLNELKLLMDSLPRPQNPESISFTGVGCFPNATAPRILWLGIKRNDHLLRVQRELTQKLAAAGFPHDQKRFTPHLTLARVNERGLVRMDARLYNVFAEKSTAASISDAPFTSLVLFRSVLNPTGPIYSPLHEISLI